MNIKRGIIGNHFISDHFNFITPFSLIINFLLHLHLIDKRLIGVIFSSEWNPVQMGWYTSCYCSGRSRIG
jgi:hypothetical protein